MKRSINIVRSLAHRETTRTQYIQNISLLLIFPTTYLNIFKIRNKFSTYY